MGSKNSFIRCTLFTLFLFVITFGVFGWTIDSLLLRWVHFSQSSSSSSSSSSTTIKIIKSTNKSKVASSASSSSRNSFNNESSKRIPAMPVTHNKIQTKQQIKKSSSSPSLNLQQSTSISSSCRRHCDHRHPYYRNSIVYSHDDKAGLYDREFLLRTLANIAFYLCATLEILKPHDLLTPKHNFNQSVSINMSWYDFYNLSSNGDEDDVVTTKHNRSIVEMDYATMQERQKELQKKIKNSSSGQEALTTTTTRVKIITTSRAEFALQDLQQVEAISWNTNNSSSSAFVWEISVSWWYVRKYFQHILDQRRNDVIWYDRYSMLPNFVGNNDNNNNNNNNNDLLGLYQSKQYGGRGARGGQTTGSREGCSYISMTVPNDMQIFLDDLWKMNFPEHSNNMKSIGKDTEKRRVTGILHIRRGDTIQECDTSLERIKSYLDCTFEGFDFVLPPAAASSSQKGVDSTKHNDDDDQDHKNGSTSSRNTIEMTILLASDERDQEYRRVVTETLQTMGILVVDADDMIWTHLQRAVTLGRMSPDSLNNYYAFRLLDALRFDSEKISLVLEQRRKRHCALCDREKVIKAIRS